MTVQYTTILVTKKYFGFPRLLFSQFTDAAIYCNSFSNLLPLSFVLGFFVSRVYTRFWEQLSLIPWPVRPAIYVSAYLRGHSDESRMMRRSILRYLVLSLVITLTSISPQAKKRFPTLTHMTAAGFLLPKEQSMMESMAYTGNKYLVPCVWAAAIVERARKEGKIKDDLAVQKLINEINEWRGSCGGLFGYDAVTVPLVYTQVITVAVYIFVITCLIGRRETDDGFRGDFNFPFFTLANIVIYVGWMKVAEAMFNPFGDDDDDFEVNALIDRHLQESYLVVDTIHETLPEMIKDLYWNQATFNIPYTAATIHTNKPSFQGSAVGMDVPEDQQQFVTQDVLMGSRKHSAVAKLSVDAVQHSDNPVHRPSLKPSESNISEVSFHTAASDRQLSSTSTDEQTRNVKTQSSHMVVTIQNSKSNGSQTSVLEETSKEREK